MWSCHARGNLYTRSTSPQPLRLPCVEASHALLQLQLLAELRTQHARAVLLPYCRRYEGIIRSSSFTIQDSDAGLALNTARLAPAVAAMVTITASSGGTAAGLNPAGTAGLVCGAATAGSGLLASAAKKCMASAGCNATVGACADAAKGDLSGWGAWLDLPPSATNASQWELWLPPPPGKADKLGSASAAAGCDDGWLPEAVLAGHYGYRTFLSYSRCMGGAVADRNCS